jgi:hypothetical protein
MNNVPNYYYSLHISHYIKYIGDNRSACLNLFFVWKYIMDFDGYTTSPLNRESFHSESPLDKSLIDFIIRIFEVNLNTHPIKFFLI